MKGRILAALAVAWLAAGVALAQAPGAYLDVEMVRVKPEKQVEFDALNKKMAEANRRNHGDNWITQETLYGENNVVYYVSLRANYGAIEKGQEAFISAATKAFGKAGLDKLFQDYSNTIISSRSEVRRRRWDLSYNPPDAAAYIRMVGQARWVRTIIVHVKPGQDLVFEAALRAINGAAQKSNEPASVFVSQGDSGERGNVYYISWLLPSLADVDKGTPLPKMLGEKGFQNFLRSVAESAQGSETIISRVVPEESNPPEEVVAVAPDFWRPKPPAAAKPKPKAAAKGNAKPAANQ
ncbi:MAG TPA: hypothetical protein VGW33_05145 [Terriglobia bacterium]|nr:hypothetical protein [Terriglobia bacterium]